MAPSVTAAVPLNQTLKLSLGLSWCHSTAKLHAGTGHALLYLFLPLNKPTLAFPNPVGCQPQSPLSPPWDRTGGSVTLRSKGAASRAVSCPVQDKKKCHQSLLETVTEGRVKITQLCLFAVMRFLIPSPNLALSLLQLYDAIRETLSQFCWKNSPKSSRDPWKIEEEEKDSSAQTDTFLQRQRACSPQSVQRFHSIPKQPTCLQLTSHKNAEGSLISGYMSLWGGKG